MDMIDSVVNWGAEKLTAKTICMIALCCFVVRHNMLAFYMAARTLAPFVGGSCPGEVRDSGLFKPSLWQCLTRMVTLEEEGERHSNPFQAWAGKMPEAERGHVDLKF